MVENNQLISIIIFNDLSNIESVLELFLIKFKSFHHFPQCEVFKVLFKILFTKDCTRVESRGKFAVILKQYFLNDSSHLNQVSLPQVFMHKF